MNSILNAVSVFFIPVMLTVIIGYGVFKKAPVYDLFVEGAKSGILTAFDILPFIIAIFVGIEAVVASGAMNFFQDALAPIFRCMGIPEELISMILLRPVSGSGSLALLEKLMAMYGADSLVGRAASVMLGSCETVFYVLALYFGVTAVKNIRHAFIAGIAGYIAGVYASVLLCRIM